jgi:hypothetical protein
LIRAVSYSLTAASEVADGALDTISLYCASAFLGSVFAIFRASSILAESAGAILSLIVQGYDLWLELQESSKCVARKRRESEEHVMIRNYQKFRDKIKLFLNFCSPGIIYELAMVRQICALVKPARIKLIIFLYL